MTAAGGQHLRLICKHVRALPREGSPMTYKTHIAGAACLTALWSSSKRLPADSSLLYVAIAASAAVLPDIDCAGSWVSRRLKCPGSAIRLFTSHRGILHAPAFWLIVCAVLASSSRLAAYLTPFGIGVYSHMLLDAMTPAGIPLFWPLSRRKIHFLKIAAGSGWELILRAALWICLAWLIFFSLNA